MPACFPTGFENSVRLERIIKGLYKARTELYYIFPNTQPERELLPKLVNGINDMIDMANYVLHQKEAS